MTSLDPTLLPCRRVPGRVSDHLPCMPVQTHGRHENQVRYIDDTEDDHRLPRCEFRSYLLREVECEQEGDYSCEEEPLGHWVAEE